MASVNRNLNSNGYDPNVDYSAAIEAEKAKGDNADKALISALESERDQKVKYQYGGNEPTMYGSNQTYGQLTGASASGGSGAQSTIDKAVGFANSDGATYHGANDVYKAAYDAAAAGDWDKVGRLVNQLETTDAQGRGNLAETNRYMQQLQELFGYDANDYYRKQYDAVYGEGAWDGGTGTGQPVYNAFSDALVQMYNQSAAQNGVQGQQSAQQALQSLQGATGAAGFQTMGGYDDMTQYINDMYAANLEAELAALKSAYDSNVAELENQNDKIAEQFRAARNQAAGQNALEAQRMNEIGIAQGLNTGATGQMALAQNMAYQGTLGNLWAQEAQTQADVDLALAQLMNQYNANVNQTSAQINAQRNQALYEEMVRQQELAAQQAELSREYALNLISKGVMPDSATLSSGGISATEASALMKMMNAKVGSSTATAPGVATPTYNNGSLTPNEVMRLQTDINKYLPADQQIAVDGKWGESTANAAGGLTADQYAAIYYKQNSWSGRSDR